MQPLRFEEARNVVLERIRALKRVPATETVPLDEAAGRILAETAFADRDYRRSTARPATASPSSPRT